MSFESYMECREYQAINHKWYKANHFVHESINYLKQEVINEIPANRFVPTLPCYILSLFYLFDIICSFWKKQKMYFDLEQSSRIIVSKYYVS